MNFLLSSAFTTIWSLLFIAISHSQINIKQVFEVDTDRPVKSASGLPPNSAKYALIDLESDMLVVSHRFMFGHRGVEFYDTKGVQVQVTKETQELYEQRFDFPVKNGGFHGGILCDHASIGLAYGVVEGNIQNILGVDFKDMKGSPLLGLEIELEPTAVIGINAYHYHDGQYYFAYTYEDEKSEEEGIYLAFGKQGSDPTLSYLDFDDLEKFYKSKKRQGSFLNPTAAKIIGTKKSAQVSHIWKHDGSYYLLNFIFTREATNSTSFESGSMGGHALVGGGYTMHSPSRYTGIKNFKQGQLIKVNEAGKVEDVLVFNVDVAAYQDAIAALPDFDQSKIRLASFTYQENAFGIEKVTGVNLMTISTSEFTLEKSFLDLGNFLELKPYVTSAEEFRIKMFEEELLIYGMRWKKKGKKDVFSALRLSVDQWP